MPLPELITNQVESVLTLFCKQRVPDHAKDQFRLTFDTRGNNVTLCSERLLSSDLSRWTNMPIAQLRFDPKSKKWSLYCKHRDERWRRYINSIPTTNFEELVHEVDEDPTGYTKWKGPSPTDCHDLELTKTSPRKKAWQCYHAAERKGYVFEIEKARYLSAAHIGLIKELIKRAQPIMVDRCFFVLLASICDRPDIFLASVPPPAVCAILRADMNVKVIIERGEDEYFVAHVPAWRQSRFDPPGFRRSAD
ncbi:MAG: DUF3024 domain-containing protein [Pyrinomonadaceae bacterium]